MLRQFNRKTLTRFSLKLEQVMEMFENEDLDTPPSPVLVDAMALASMPMANNLAA